MHKLINPVKQNDKQKRRKDTQINLEIRGFCRILSFKAAFQA